VTAVGHSEGDRGRRATGVSDVEMDVNCSMANRSVTPGAPPCRTEDGP
jgi:hypothetical protein